MSPVAEQGLGMGMWEQVGVPRIALSLLMSTVLLPAPALTEILVCVTSVQERAGRERLIALLTPGGTFSLPDPREHVSDDTVI